MLGEVGFAQYNIPNRIIKNAYGMNMPDLRKYLIQSVSPVKKKKKRLASGEVGWASVKHRIYDVDDG